MGLPEWRIKNIIIIMVIAAASSLPMNSVRVIPNFNIAKVARPHKIALLSAYDKQINMVLHISPPT